MKVKSEILAFIEKAVRTARLVNIDNIIIEPDRVRGIDEQKSVLLLQTDDIPLLSTGSMGLSRLDGFQSRLAIVKELDGFNVDADTDKENEFVRSLTFKAKGTKAEYRCANPSNIQAPKAINDQIVAEITVIPEDVEAMKSATTAYSAELVEIIGSTSDGYSFELMDLNGDTFSRTFKDNPEGPEANFRHKYPVKTLLSLFKEEPDCRFGIGQKGILKIEVNDLDVFVLPRV